MPAPDFETCYDIETAIEGATTSMLSASILMFDNPRATTIHETPSVHVRLILGEPLGHLQPILNSSGSVVTAKYDAWDAVLEANVITDRGSDNAYHKHYVRHVRNVLNDYHNYKPYLQYHDVLNVIQGSLIMSLDDNKNQDITTMNFNLKVCVDPSAWPTSSI